jgi:hypothetical protein
LDGVAVGSLYALIALGYTMVYGILRFINFAHSDVFMLGAWVSWALAMALGYSGVGAEIPWFAPALVLVGSMAACGLLGFLIERLAYRRLRSAPRINVLITAIVALEVGNALALEPEDLPALGAFGHLHLHHAVQRGHLELRAQRGLHEADRHFAEHFVFLAVEERVLLHVHHDVQIARGAALLARLTFTGQPHARAGVDPGGNLD